MEISLRPPTDNSVGYWVPDQIQNQIQRFAENHKAGVSSPISEIGAARAYEGQPQNPPPNTARAGHVTPPPPLVLGLFQARPQRDDDNRHLLADISSCGEAAAILDIYIYREREICPALLRCSCRYQPTKNYVPYLQVLRVISTSLPPHISSFLYVSERKAAYFPGKLI